MENATVPATIRDDADPSRQIVLCVAPPDLATQGRRDVALSVAQNGQDYVRRPLRYQYYSLDKLGIQHLQPSGGPEGGGTLVVLKGKQIGNSRGGLRCEFASTWVLATARGLNSVQCMSPAHPTNNGSYEAVHVRVTVNSDPMAASIAALPFVYFRTARVLAISSIYPRAGLAGGGAAITIIGSGFRDLGGIFCQFGESNPVLAQAPPPPLPPRPPPGQEGEIRLANGGPSSRSGRVEIYHNGSWGTVCDDNWDISDARAVCRQLGYPDALNATCCGAHGIGAEQIWLDNVNCPGHAERLDQCGSQGWGVHDCDHHEDAGVICAPPIDPTMPSPAPSTPPPPREPWARLDDFQLTRSYDGQQLGTLEQSTVAHSLQTIGILEFESFVCRSPSLDEALDQNNHRLAQITLEVRVTINADTYGAGQGQNFTYYTQ